jgi:6-phosphogluconolactonase
MLELLPSEALAGAGVAVFQVDERVAPEGDPDRNLTAIRAALPDAALDRLRPMPVDEADLEGATARYEEALPGRLDLVHLGLGADGHTASLVPGDAVLEVRDRRVAMTAGEYQGRRRMTLTYPALNAARRILWLVAGEDKRDALGRLLKGDRSIPAGRVESADSIVICDRAAAPDTAR